MENTGLEHCYGMKCLVQFREPLAIGAPSSDRPTMDAMLTPLGELRTALVQGQLVPARRQYWPCQQKDDAGALVLEARVFPCGAGRVLVAYETVTDHGTYVVKASVAVTDLVAVSIIEDQQPQTSPIVRPGSA